MKVSGKRIYFRTFVLTKDHILILSNTMNKYRIIFSCFIALLLLPAMAHAADGERRIVVVTLDGYRWQELFGGADSAIINNKSFGDVADMKAAWWKASREERRETQHSSQTWLMAFGAGIPAKGVLTSGEYHNNQVAPTIAELLGFTFQPKHEGVGKPIKF